MHRAIFALTVKHTSLEREKSKKLLGCKVKQDNLMSQSHSSEPLGLNDLQIELERQALHTYFAMELYCQKINLLNHRLILANANKKLNIGFLNSARYIRETIDS